MNYTHLSRTERYQIEVLFEGGWSDRAIAERIGRSASTVGRERRRNAKADGTYESGHAHRCGTERRRLASAWPRIPPAQWETVEERLRQENWSPQQIAGHGEVAISHARIYQHVAEDRRRGGTLWGHLRCRKRRRRRRCGTPRRRQRFGGRRIHQRPAIVAARRRVGDWEGDTIVGAGLARIVTLVERKTGLVRLRRVASGEAGPTMRAIVHALHALRERVHTLTWDNGSEFAEHALIDIALGARSYFADAFASWQRGSNENLNGLLRQYFPKGCDLAAITDQALQHVEDQLNQRPRKRLRYRTPQVRFEASFKRGALRG